MSLPIVTRNEAIERGMGRYFTGKPCKHGHLSQRSTVSAACLMCLSEAQKNIKKRKNKALMLSAMGFQKIEIRVWPDDVPLMRTIVDLINHRRLHPEEVPSYIERLATFSRELEQEAKAR